MTAGIHEPLIADEWIFASLQASPDLTDLGSGDTFRAYPDIAPKESLYPLIIYSFMTGTDERAIGPTHLWTNMRYLVKLVSKGGSFATYKNLMAAIDAALEGIGGTAPDGNVYGCIAVAPFRYTETSGGEIYRHQGRTYALVAQSL